MAEYYVYCLFLPDGTPFYIGKGKGRRINDHGTTRGRLAAVNQVLASIQRDGGECQRAVLLSGLSESEAFDLERDLILEIGRAPDGPLVNANDGGWGGRNPHPETREKIRAARLAQESPSRDHMVMMNKRRGPWTAEQRKKVADAMTGRHVSEETRQKIAKAPKARPGPERMRELAAIRNSNTSDETRAKLREAAKRQVWTSERRAKISAAQKGRKSDPEANAKRSASLKGRAKSPEHLAAIAAAKAAKKAACM